MLKRYGKYKLLIIDEIGCLPIENDDTKSFFQLIDMRYETKSTTFTTKLNQLVDSLGFVKSSDSCCQ